MPAWEVDGIFNVFGNFKWVGNLFRECVGLGDFYGIGIVFVVDEIIVRGLVTADVGLSVQIIFVTVMDVEVVRLDGADYGDVRRFFKIPELETAHFVNDNGIFSETIQSFNGWHADIADKICVGIFGIKKGFDEGAGGTFSFSGGNANDFTRAVVKKVFGDAGFVFEMERRDGRATKNQVVVGKISVF